MRNFYFKRDARINHITSGKGIVNDEPHIWRTLDQCELFIVTDGMLCLRQGDESYELSKGEYLVTERNIEYGGDKPMNGAFHWLHFDYPQGDAFFSDDAQAVGRDYMSFPKHGHLRETESIVVLNVLLEQYAMIGAKKPVTDALLLALLLDICESVSGKPAPPAKDKRFQPIIEYLHNNPHYSDFRDVKGMAEFFGYNERYLIRLFKKNTGMTPHEYLTSKKIARAQEMLAETDMTIKSIASVLKFDYYYFLRLFRKHTGMSPSEFRRSVIPDWARYLPPDGE